MEGSAERLLALKIVYPVLRNVAGWPDGDHGATEETSWRQTLLDMCVKTTVNTTEDKNKSHYDLEIRIIPALFQRFQTNGELVLLSRWNLSRSFSSAIDLAQFLMPQLESVCCETFAPECPIVRIQFRRGYICVTSPERIRKLTAAGLAPCPLCASWLQGSKGVWWHTVKHHKVKYTTAVQQTASLVNTSRALTVYSAHRQKHEGGKTETVAAADDQPASNEKGEDLQSTDETFCPWTLTKEGNLEDLQRYLAENEGNFDPIKSLDQNGAVLLLWAAGNGHLRIVQYLVEHCKCPVNLTQKGRNSFNGRTALHWAARQGQLDVVRYLLHQNNIDIHAETQDGTTAFHWAAWQGHLQIMQFLVDAIEENEVLHVVQHVNSYGCNASMWAAQGNADLLVFTWLKAASCPLDRVNYSNHGVLHKAAQRGHFEICEWYCKAVLPTISDWKPIGPDEDGCMASDIAGMEGFEKVAMYLAGQEEDYSLRLLDKEPRPKWLDRVACPSKERLWEPLAGVARIRAAMQQCKTASE